MNVLYITKSLPFGVSEAFIIPEIMSHRAAGWDVWVAPLSPGTTTHEFAAQIASRTLTAPLFGTNILTASLRMVLRSPVRVLAAIKPLLASRSPILMIKNIAVVPKALWLAEKIIFLRIDHVHIHWIAVPGTFGAIASQVAGVPWSITAHRYDIAQNNLIPWKMKNAGFVRAIDRRGADELRNAARGTHQDPCLLHMGVSVGDEPTCARRVHPVRIVTAARFVEKKGHRYILEALRYARDRGHRVEADFYGDGPLRLDLLRSAVEIGVEDQVQFRGPLAHAALLSALRSGDYAAAVLPSVTADDSDREGIPVFLMESMAAGTPVITTRNGGIDELVDQANGTIVRERDSTDLGEALIELAMHDAKFAKKALRARQTVTSRFDVEKCMARLRQLIEETNGRGPNI